MTSVFIKKYFLDFTVFFTGVSIMTVEILGFGIVAPYFGTALSVSSNLLGLILFGLSVGYFVGGKLADKKGYDGFFPYTLLAISVFLGTVFLSRDLLAVYIRVNVSGIMWGSFWTIFILFVPVNILMGMVLPYAAKLKVSDISSSGRDTGFLYFLSAGGSVLGTFGAGFLLIPHANIPTTIFILALLFLLLSVFLSLSKSYLVFIPIFIFIFFYSEKIAPLEYVYGNNKFSIDGSVTIDRTKLKKIDDVNGQYSRIQIYEGIDENTQKPIRLMRINKELHSGAFLDTNELVFKYAKFNRLGGHFNPDAKKALLIGGGGYSYANYFLGDTPLFDTEKIWFLDGKFYGNNRKISLPILISSDKDKLNLKRRLIFEDAKAKGSEEEGIYNFIEADNQKPGAKIIVKRADINKTSFPLNNGFIHVHEVSRNGMPGKVISPNFYINKQGNRIGHSELISGENKDAAINLDRHSREGEVLYPMLHRDNGNDRFDPLLVDGYENIKSLDVVEIDPETTRLASKYFNLNKNDPRLRIFHEDGRTYINHTKEKYDIVYVDAFRSFYSVPFQLMTLEAAQKLYNLLAENGVLVFNIPSALSGKMGKSFQAAYKTFKIVFPALKVYAVSDPKNQEIVQNMVVVGFKSKDNIRESLNDDSEINEQLSNLWEEKMEDNIPILTDDFAPVDFYINKLIGIPTM